MFIYSLRIARGAFRLVFAAAVVSLLTLVLASHVLPLVGMDVYVARGGSMAPAIPVGSAVLVSIGEIESVQAGDVITFRGTNGTVITHRVVGRDAGPTATFHTKGDASDSPDAFAVGSDAVIGRVTGFVPVAGGVLLMLGTTIGVVATLALLTGLGVAAWFMDHLVAGFRPVGRTAVRAGGTS
jgi:signal peptidase